MSVLVMSSSWDPGAVVGAGAEHFGGAVGEPSSASFPGGTITSMPPSPPPGGAAKAGLDQLEAGDVPVQERDDRALAVVVERRVRLPSASIPPHSPRCWSRPG